jgi:hypothetical protein
MFSREQSFESAQYRKSLRPATARSVFQVSMWVRESLALPSAYFRPSWTAFQADRGRHFSVIVDGVSD